MKRLINRLRHIFHLRRKRDTYETRWRIRKPWQPGEF